MSSVYLLEIGNWTHSKRKTCLQFEDDKSGLRVIFVSTFVMHDGCQDIAGVRRCNCCKISESKSAFEIVSDAYKMWGHCATSRKVAGSIPDGVIGIFH